jgi:hypothetical protein
LYIGCWHCNNITSDFTSKEEYNCIVPIKYQN